MPRSRNVRSALAEAVISGNCEMGYALIDGEADVDPSSPEQGRQ